MTSPTPDHWQAPAVEPLTGPDGQTEEATAAIRNLLAPSSTPAPPT